MESVYPAFWFKKQFPILRCLFQNITTSNERIHINTHTLSLSLSFALGKRKKCNCTFLFGLSLFLCSLYFHSLTLFLPISFWWLFPFFLFCFCFSFIYSHLVLSQMIPIVQRIYTSIFKTHIVLCTHTTVKYSDVLSHARINANLLFKFCCFSFPQCIFVIF